MLLRTSLCLALVVAACGDDVAATTLAPGTSTGEATSVGATEISAGQTSAPEPTGGLPQPTTDGPATEGHATTEPDPTAPTGTTGAPIDCTEIVVPDPGLGQQLLMQLGLDAGPIPIELALATDKLVLKGPEIHALDGLECFANLRTLSIFGPGELADFAPLAGLIKLETLVIRSQALSSLASLAGLVKLETLDLSANAIVDLAPLAGLSQLNLLYVDDNPVASFAALAGLPALTNLQAVRTTPGDLGGLAQIPNLARLGLNEAGLVDLGPLAGAAALTHLDLARNKIVDLTPLAGHSQLQHLDLAENAVKTLSPLAGLPVLETIDLGSNQISDPAPLAAFTTLTSLRLADNPLKAGLAALLPLTKLERLDINGTGTSQLAALAPATLWHLSAEHNQIADLTPLAQHADLAELKLADNAIVSATPIIIAPFWALPCVHLDLTDNPLDVESQTVHLPGLCAAEDAIQWDQDSCLGCARGLLSPTQTPAWRGDG